MLCQSINHRSPSPRPFVYDASTQWSVVGKIRRRRRRKVLWWLDPKALSAASPQIAARGRENIVSPLSPMTTTTTTTTYIFPSDAAAASFWRNGRLYTICVTWAWKKRHRSQDSFLSSNCVMCVCMTVEQQRWWWTMMATMAMSNKPIERERAYIIMKRCELHVATRHKGSK